MLDMYLGIQACLGCQGDLKFVIQSFENIST